ncbi:MAG: HD domain-containing protein [Mogibacterium sp.]|nr:HD domain-containing protein [Mogibacterium sp.]
MEKPYNENTLVRQLQERRADRKARIQRDLERYGSEVLQSEEMQRAFQQTHHQWSTVGEHTVRVTFSSVMICYVLRKLNIKVNIPAVVVGALCHDLGILGRSGKYTSQKECLREHPKESVAVARELVENLPEKTEDIIERHMWPAGNSKAPNSIEGAVVSIADKYSAVKDIIKGSEVNHTGVKNFLHDEKEKIMDMFGPGEDSGLE